MGVSTMHVYMILTLSLLLSTHVTCNLALNRGRVYVIQMGCVTGMGLLHSVLVVAPLDMRNVAGMIVEMVNAALLDTRRAAARWTDDDTIFLLNFTTTERKSNKL